MSMGRRLNIKELSVLAGEVWKYSSPKLPAADKVDVPRISVLLMEIFSPGVKTSKQP